MTGSSSDSGRACGGGEVPSKSERKRDLLALQHLGERLVALPIPKLTALSLDLEVRLAIEECRRIRSHGARRRQIRWIAKLLSRCDNVDDILALMDRRDDVLAREKQRQGDLQGWRQRLIDEGDPAIEAFVSLHPQGDRQQLRTLVRQARQEFAQGHPPAASRRLLQLLRQLDGE